jgi:hypothetical protein
MMTSQTVTPDPGAYAHVLVVMSMVLGLAVTQLMKGAAQLYRTRARVQTYWLHWAWAILILFFSLLLWWTYWHYRTITVWTFPRFVLYLSPVVVFYFLASLVFPDPAEGVTDLKAYYFSNRGGLFGTFAVYTVVAGITATMVRGLPLTDPSHLFRVGTVILMIVAMRSANPRVHSVLFVLAVLLMLAFIALFQFRLG